MGFDDVKGNFADNLVRLFIREKYGSKTDEEKRQIYEKITDPAKEIQDSSVKTREFSHWLHNDIEIKIKGKK